MSDDYAVVIAARMGSERLPGKCLAELAPGICVLSQLIERWQASDREPVVIVATPTGSANDLIADAAHSMGVAVSRMPPGNAVSEIDAALQRFCPHAAYVARALADNPLVDVALADWRLDVLAETGADGLWYGADHDRITYAGTTDVWSRRAWDRIAEGSSGSQLAHPGAYFWDRLHEFSTVQLPLPRREYVDAARTELDTPLDLEMLRAVWQAWAAQFYASEMIDPEPLAPVPTLWALKWLAAHPEVADLNRGVTVKTQTRALFGARNRAWLCETCSGRVGSVKDGNLEIHCQGCGNSKRWYIQKQKA